jgi:hypothetical protein
MPGIQGEFSVALQKWSAGMSTEIDPWQHSPTKVGNEQLGNMAMYSLMHEVLTTQEKRQFDWVWLQEDGGELRRNKRKKFSCIQLVAPFEGRRMPSQAEFQPQLCHDLSPNGFSFWTQSQLTQSHLIVALGEVPFLFFVAEIVHQTYEPLGEPGGWRIGCRFIRRVDR